ncbi:MAG TPA: hypothetical protein VMF88_02435 [Bacteroidota bacterium]|nr:hypothetical protein [Bacteroidota bacterium]
MKLKFTFIGVVVAVFAVFFWGCSSESQDPVSSAGGYGGGKENAKVLYKSIPAPANVTAAVNGSTVTVSWDTVTTAMDYHLIVLSGTNTYVDTIIASPQFVLTNVPSGTYTVTVAAILSGIPEGTASTPISFTLSSVAPPTVTVKALPVPLCTRNGEWVMVVFSGVVVNSQGGASYQLIDEFGQVHYTGTVAAGPYAVKLSLKDRNPWFDRDVRQYTFIITAANSAGTAQASVTVKIPLDKNFPDRRDKDGWDDRR